MRIAPYVISGDAAADVVRAVRAAKADGVALVFDKRVAGRASEMTARLRRAGFRVICSLGVRGGEGIKRLSFVNRLCDYLAACAAERSSIIVAVGGGAVTDAVGFAAATYMRGISWIAVATTVLGMADAAIGGKTGVDVARRKNLVGAFWQPSASIADLRALATLPVIHRRTGMTEIIKAAVIGDARLLEMCSTFDIRSDGTDWRALIARGAAVKLRIAARDPKERGERAKLNLGHTVGHALESASAFRMSHGAAVAIGLRAAGLLSISRGLWQPHDHARMLQALAYAGLPLHTPIASSAAAFAALKSDKKRVAGSSRFVLPTSIGKVIHGVTVRDAAVRRIMCRCSRPPGRDELEA
ncbi:MAG TPA: 3-dehydroquinate synthase family protein [Candidatus Eremiobacteraceae bacterium]|nr:3-dehydroquinate synthase family protein [Candidatus Eremiobacteraceae bacterium]